MFILYEILSLSSYFLKFCLVWADEFLRGQIYLPVNKLEFRTFDSSRRTKNSSFERELIKKSSDNVVFHRILFTKENYIIFLNTPVLGTHTVVSKSLIRLRRNTSTNLLKTLYELQKWIELTLQKSLPRIRSASHKPGRRKGLFSCPGVARQECYDVFPVSCPSKRSRLFLPCVEFMIAFRSALLNNRF